MVDSWDDPGFHETDNYNLPSTRWINGVEYGDDDLPVHLMMPVDRRGNGPLCDAAPHCGCCDDIAKWICWCGDKSCPGPDLRAHYGRMNR